MSPEEINRMLDVLPSKVSHILKTEIAASISQGPFELIKKWVEEYDKTHTIDMVVANTLGGVLMEFTKRLEVLKDSHEKSTGKNLGEAMIKALRAAADKTENALEEAREYHEKKDKERMKRNINN